MMTFDLSVIIPVRNESSNIALTLENLEKQLDISHDTIVVNDHSQDSTRMVVSDFINRGFTNVKLVDNAYEAGLAGAFKTGIDVMQSDVLVFLMGDSCDSISTIKDMYSKIAEGYDLVCASRYMKGGSRIGGNRLKGFFSWFVGSSLHLITQIPTRDVSNNFKMYRKKSVSEITIESKGFESALELSLKLYFGGYRVTEVPTLWREIRQGKSNFKMPRLIGSYLKWYLWGIFTKIKMETKRCFTR